MTEPQVAPRPAAAAEPRVSTKPQSVRADLWSAAGSVIAWRSQMPPLCHEEAEGPIPLSMAQERLWSLEQSEPGAAYYHIPLTWEIQGELDVDALRQAFRFLAQRHEALRTSFPVTETGPIQKINDDLPKLVVEDVSRFPNGEAVAESWKRARRFVQQPMDLARGPLMRAVLYRRSATSHWLVAIFHQMIFDGASMRVFNRELGQCYSAYAAGREPVLEPLPITYADFSRWQLDCARQAKAAAEYWQARLQRQYKPLRLPADLPGKMEGVTPGAHLPFRVPKALVDALKELAHGCGITTFAAFVGAFQAYLSRITGQEDVLTFASIAARTHPALRNIVGLIANVLPLRIELSGEPTFRETLRRSGEEVSSALANQNLPLNQILEFLSVNPAHASALQTLIIYNNAPPQSLKLGAATFTPSIELDNGTAKFDFTLDIAESSEGISGFVKYRPDLYTAAAVQQMISGWEAFLRQAVAQPDQPITAFSVELIGQQTKRIHSEAESEALTVNRIAARREPYVAPQTEPQKKLAQIWENVFAIRPIGMNDNFFALGGHSLTAVKLTAAIEKETGKKLRLCTIFQQPTVGRLAKVLDHSQAKVEHSIVEIQPSGTKPPLFLVHGVGGGMFWGYNNLARELGPDQPVYGFKSRGLDGLEEFATIEEIAAHYTADLMKVQPNGPYYLGGYCFGGNVAYEMARQLQAQGREVALLLLINCWANNSSYTRVRFTPVFAVRAVMNFFVRLEHQIRRGVENPRDFLKWRAAWVMRRIKGLFMGKAEDRVSVEDIVALSSQSEEERKLWRTHFKAWLQYRPKPYAGRIVLFRTRGHPLVCSFDPEMGWGEFAAGGVSVQVCPGDHESILEEENVGQVASELRQVLEGLGDGSRESRTSQTSRVGTAWDTMPAITTAV